MLRDFSLERKEGQERGEIPVWYTTAGWQMFAEKYLFEAKTVKEQMQRIARTFAKYCDESVKPDFWEQDVFTAGKSWYQVFFDMMWSGHYIPSTPQMANTGTTRGCTVSCSGGYVKDSVVGFYDAYREAAVLTKQGFGTSYYLGDITPAGIVLPEGGKAGGVLPVLKGMIAVMEDITQTNRRGSVACSLEVTHKDFDLVADYVMLNPDGANIGWLITDKFMRKLDRGEKEAIRKWNKMLYIKMRSGRGYFVFIDKMNRHLAEPFKKAGLKVYASNLCVEVCLPANEEYSFSCVLSSLNLAKYREWSPNLEFLATVMLDCSIDDFLEQASGKAGMEKVVKFTKDFRALGLGTLGVHTLFQQEEIVVGSITSYQLNRKIFQRLDEQSKLATQWLAATRGEPVGCKGFGWRNATRIAQAPNKSSAVYGGGVSEGTGLNSAMIYTQQTAAGEVFRVNAKLLSIMKEQGIYDEEHIREVNDAKGSVQKVNWLTQHQKDFLRTGFEVRVEDVLQLASDRQPFIDQGQSINLNLTENDTGQDIGAWHKLAAEDENILTLYYIISMRDAGDIGKNRGECETCSN